MPVRIRRNHQRPRNRADRRGPWSPDEIAGEEHGTAHEDRACGTPASILAQRSGTSGKMEKPCRDSIVRSSTGRWPPPCGSWRGDDAAECHRGPPGHHRSRDGRPLRRLHPRTRPSRQLADLPRRHRLIASLYSGMGVLVARFTGACEPEKVNRVVQQAFLTSMFLSVVLAIAGYVLAPYLLDVVRAAPDVKGPPCRSCGRCSSATSACSSSSCSRRVPRRGRRAHAPPARHRGHRAQCASMSC